MSSRGPTLLFCLLKAAHIEHVIEPSGASNRKSERVQKEGTAHNQVVLMVCITSVLLLAPFLLQLVNYFLISLVQFSF